MDISDMLRKMFKNKEKNDDPNREKDPRDSFRKPRWLEESESDDELFDDDRNFAFHIFTNPLELQKHFERQMQEVLETMKNFEESDDVKVNPDFKEGCSPSSDSSEILKEFEKNRKSFIDTDLDGEIYADELHSLMQRLTAAGKDERNMEGHTKSILPRNDNRNRKFPNKKVLSDEEIIMDRIHGTFKEEPSPPAHQPRLDISSLPSTGSSPFAGVFSGTYQGPKMFRQSVMTTTQRKSNGTYETTKVVQDSQGNKTTTITRTSPNGKSETVTKYDGATETAVGSQNGVASAPHRNIYVSKNGYAMPRNLW